MGEIKRGIKEIIKITILENWVVMAVALIIFAISKIAS